MKIQQWLFKILRKQNLTDWRTDNVKTVYPPQTKFAEGINSVDPEQTASIGAVWSGSTLFAMEAS